MRLEKEKHRHYPENIEKQKSFVESQKIYAESRMKAERGSN
jgi:hypothetical protein